MDFVSIWKACSIALTGAFGILGLSTEFKDKATNKITKWGYVSLAGILISTVLGLAAQLKESADDSAKALALAAGMNRTIHEIDRGLNRLENPAISLNLAVPCGENRYRKFCDQLRKQVRNEMSTVQAKGWKDWPLRPDDIMFRVNFFVDRGGKPYVPTDTQFGDLSFSLQAGEDLRLVAIPKGKEGALIIGDSNSPTVINNNGNLNSILDFHRVTLVIVSDLPNTDDFELTSFDMSVKGGQEIGRNSMSEIKKTEIGDHTAYICRFY